MLLAGLLLLLALAPVIARAQGASTDTLTLAWTAPGDDGTLGRATRYDVRWSTSPISDANFGSATAVSSTPAPVSAGSRQIMVVRGLSKGTTYYFALKTSDDAGNVSAISNVVRWDWVYDTAPPSPPTGVGAPGVTAGSVHLHWNANSEPDLAGYRIYRATAGSGGPWTRADGPGLTDTNDWTDASLPAGETRLWYRISAVDISGNESARSSSVAVTLSSPPAGGGSLAWHLDPVYPNPSRIGSPVTLPLTVGSGGGGSIDIIDAGRRMVRHIDLGSFGTGLQNVTWDGLNDAGRPVAPGFYTAWVVAGGTRQSVKLVRVP
jgi:hypothetical protein